MGKDKVSNPSYSTPTKPMSCTSATHRLFCLSPASAKVQSIYDNLIFRVEFLASRILSIAITLRWPARHPFGLISLPLPRTLPSLKVSCPWGYRNASNFITLFWKLEVWRRKYPNIRLGVNNPCRWSEVHVVLTISGSLKIFLSSIDYWRQLQISHGQPQPSPLKKFRSRLSRPQKRH